MPHSKPVATDLLEVVNSYLQEQLAPLVPPYHQFQLRIVARLLGTVQRQLQSGAAFDAQEHQRLVALLKHDGPLADLNRELAGQIRDGNWPIDDAALMAHVRQTIEDSLRINNPKWIADAPARAHG